jgi:hypothetical protein
VGVSRREEDVVRLSFRSSAVYLMCNDRLLRMTSRRETRRSAIKEVKEGAMGVMSVRSKVTSRDKEPKWL